MPNLDQESFIAHFEAATRQAGFEVESRRGLELRVIVHEQSMRCNLEQMYQIYQGAPDRIDDLVQAHLSALKQVPPAPPKPTEKEAAESLLPILQPKQWITEMERGDMDIPIPIHQPFAGGLVITYVLDFPEYRVFLSPAVMPQFMGQFDPPLDAIHQYALENLRKRTTSQHYETHGLGKDTLVVCETKDGFAAARILLPELMETWAGRIPGRMLIGVPNRDFLIAFSDRDPEHVAAMSQQVHRDAKVRQHALCGELLLWENGRVREYQIRH
ncbi:MAG: DUF1444 family protein [Anaerolineales bacterium]|nr:DUF1444 family protein [Anaerolineales bacterium]